MTDVVVVGGGPAGLSAAVNIRAGNCNTVVISNPIEDNPLYQASVINNYPGMPEISGAQLLKTLRNHAEQSGAQFRWNHVTAIVPSDLGFLVNVNGETEQAKSVVIAVGAIHEQVFPGERELLGRGVSWCATCDGRLYYGRDVVVIGLSPGAVDEANYLQQLGCRVTYVTQEIPQGLLDEIPVVTAKQIVVHGDQNVDSVEADGTMIPCQGVFILRQSPAISDIFPQLRLMDEYVETQAPFMATSIPGIFACGDCTSPLHQAAVATGQGQAAGLSAAAFVRSSR